MQSFGNSPLPWVVYIPNQEGAVRLPDESVDLIKNLEVTTIYTKHEIFEKTDDIIVRDVDINFYARIEALPEVGSTLDNWILVVSTDENRICVYIFRNKYCIESIGDLINYTEEYNKHNSNLPKSARKI